MCLIAIKPKGIPINKDFYKALVRSYYLRNEDGCGFAIKRNNAKTIYFRKSIFNIKFLIKELKHLNIQPDDELVVHLRKVSAGSKFMVNTHPFVMSTEMSKINQLQGEVTDDLLFHNGTFMSFQNHKNIYSDTWKFVYNIACGKFFTTLCSSLRNRKRDEGLNHIFHRNKVVIMSLEKKLFIYNEKEFTKDSNGFIFSNFSFVKQPHPRDMKRPVYSEADMFDEFNHRNGYDNRNWGAHARGWHAD